MNYIMLDDSKTDCQLLEYALAETGKKSNFMQINSFSEAKDFFENNSISEPTLVCIDLNFPDGDGFVLLECVNECVKNQYNIIPIVLSTSASDRDIKKAREMGAFSYVVKPADFVDWVEFINNTERYWSTVNRFPGGE